MSNKPIIIKWSKEMRGTSVNCQNIPDLRGNVFSQFNRFVKQTFCKHKNKTEMLKYYQEGYAIDICDKCGKVI
jgi:hypothetical protein